MTTRIPASAAKRWAAHSASQGPMPSSPRSVLPQARMRHRALFMHLIVARSAAPDLVHNFAIRRDQRENQRHLTKGMGRAAEARIEGADHRLDAVQRAFSE